MGLFKSKKEKQNNVKLSFRQMTRKAQRNKRNLEKKLEQAREKGLQAKKLGNSDNLRMVKSEMKRMLGQIRKQDKIMFVIEMAMQKGEQALSSISFKEAITSFSALINETYSDMDFDKSMLDFDEAMDKLDSSAEQWDDFLDGAISGDSDGFGDSEMVSDDEIDSMLVDAVLDSESSDIDDRIQAGLDRVRKELRDE